MKKISMAHNTAFYTGALTIQKVLAFVYFWFISNSLLAEQLGQYVFALSFTTMFSIFVDLGLSPVLTRESSKSIERSNSLLRNVLFLKIPLSLGTLVAAWAVIIVSGKPQPVQLLVFLASFIMLLDSFSLSFWVMFRARQNMLYESVVTIMVQIIIFTLGLTALRLSGEVKYLIAALLVASIFNFFVSLALLKFKLKFKLWPEYDPRIIRPILRIIPAFAIAGIFVKIYNTSDSVLLSYLDSDAAVGYFAIPAKVVYALQQIIPAAFAAVIFPAFSYYHATSRKLLTDVFEKAFGYLTIVSLPLAAGMMALLPQIIDQVWPAYRLTIPCFYAMAAAIPFIFLAFPTGYLLNSCDRQKNTTINRGIITLMAVVMNILLIPRLSFFGAGITFFITNFVLLFLDFFWVNRVISLDYSKLGLILGKSAIAAAIMVVAVLLAAPYFNLLILVPFGAAVYFLALYIIKGFSPADIVDLARRGSNA